MSVYAGNIFNKKIVRNGFKPFRTIIIYFIIYALRVTRHDLRIHQ